MRYSMFVFLLIFPVFLYSGHQEETDAIKGHVIGIDLGTTYSCVGVFKDGRVEILQNEQGNRITPSYIAFTESGERLVGDSAKSQLTVNPKNTVFDAKRLIGRDFNEKTVQEDMRLWPFTVKNAGGKPKIEINLPTGKQVFAPEEISAMVLSKMKSIAEERLQMNVTHAVITVPAYFTDAQRQSTKDAGRIAGLNVLRIINEPTAAAIAYGMNKKEGEKNVIVFDLGGGTFDVSVLVIDNGIFEVLSTNGDTHLGGEDFDQKVVEYIIKEIRKSKGSSFNIDSKLKQRIRREAEKAKRALSRVHETTVDIDLGQDSGDFALTLTRSKFEELNDDLFRSTLIPLGNALKQADLTKKEIDEIILVGGSTRIPKIQRLVKDFFDGKEPNRGVNPDEAVAYGAAVQGGILSGAQETSGLVLLDVTPLTLGIEVQGGEVVPIIKKNTKIPIKQTQTFTTVVDNQPKVVVNIYEGERRVTTGNNLIGSFEVSGIQPAPRGVPQIEVSYAVDHDGIINVAAVDKASGSSNSITVSNDKRQLKEEEIERMIKDAERYAAEDQAVVEKSRAKGDFESSVYNLRNQINDEKGLKDKIPEDEKKILDSALTDAISWLESNKDASVEDLKARKEEFDKVVRPIVGKYYQPPPGGVPPTEEAGAPEEEAREEL